MAAPISAKTLLLLGAGAALGAGLGLVLLLGFGRDQAAQAGVPAIGAPAPDFEAKNLAGETVRLSSLKGKPVVINFWATWCRPCVAEMPLIQNRYDRYAPGLEVLAVNFGESPDTVEAFARDRALTFPILLDSGGFVNELYRLRGYPTTYFIDAEGIIRAIQFGEMSENILDRHLKDLGIGP